MTTLQLQGLDIPATDDPMETDADRRAGQVEDIDIDLDLTGEQQQDGEDEYMSEDVATFDDQAPDDGPAGDTYKDDEMADEAFLEEGVVDAASIEDEELQDAEEIIATHADEDDEIVDVVDDEPLPTAHIPDLRDEEKPTASEDNHNQDEKSPITQAGHEQRKDMTQHDDSLDTEEHHDHDQGDLELPAEQLQEQKHRQYVIDEDGSEAQHSHIHGSAADLAAELHPDGQQRHGTPEPAVSDLVAQALTQDVGHTTKKDEALSTVQPEPVNVSGPAEDSKPTYEGHPGSESQAASIEVQTLDPIDLVDKHEDMTKASVDTPSVSVDYLGAEYDLFKQSGSDRDCFLMDEQLASNPITSLLGACRSALATLGEAVHEHELFLTVEDLDLHISEFASDASAATISQISDIYLQLQHRDGVEAPADLRIKLYAKPTFAPRLKFLRNALWEGKGLSQVKPTTHAQSEYAYNLVDPEDSTGNADAHAESLVHTDFDSREQEYQEGGSLEEETDIINPPTAPAIKKVLTQVESKTDGLVLHTFDSQLGEDSSHGGIEARSVSTPLEGEKGTQQKQKSARSDDEENIIDYDDDEVDPKSSAGSSTLLGDAEAAADQTRPSLGQPGILKGEPLPQTETSSHILGESLHEVATHSFDTNDGPGDLHDVMDKVKEPKKSQGGETVEDSVVEEVQEIGQEDVHRLAEEVDPSHDFEDATDDVNHDYDNLADTNEHRGSFEVYQGAEHQLEEYQLEEYQPEQSHLEDHETDDRDQFIRELTDTDFPEGDENARNNEEYAHGLGDFADDPTVALEDEDPISDNQESAGAAVQPPLDAAAQSQDRDEITYEDEEAEANPSNVEQDDLSSPGSLKRSRNFDADDTTAEDLQDAKRIRST